MYEKPFHHKDISNLSFLVTGGAGFIGSNIVEYLLKYGARYVRVLDDLSTGNIMNIEPFKKNSNFEFLQGDIRSYEDCKKACDGIDMITHQAALGSVPRSIQDPVNTNEVNASGFVNIIAAAKEAEIQKFVYASSSSVYGDDPSLPKVEEKTGDPLSPYAVSKKTNELYAKVFGDIYKMPVIGLRYFNVFGPNQDPRGQYAAVIPLFIDGLMKNKPVFIDGKGDQTRDFTFVENAVQANIKALTIENDVALNKVYNVAVGENFSVLDLYNILKDIIGSEQDPEFRSARVGDIKNSLADISKAKEFLGYKPEVKFKEGLERTVEYFKERFYTTINQ